MCIVSKNINKITLFKNKKCNALYSLMPTKTEAEVKQHPSPSPYSRHVRVDEIKTYVSIHNLNQSELSRTNTIKTTTVFYK